MWRVGCRRREVVVEVEGREVKAVTYQLAIPPLEDRRPSKIYRQVGFRTLLYDWEKHQQVQNNLVS